MAERESEACCSKDPPSKRLKLDDACQSGVSEDSGLVQFCDDLLLEIFSYVHKSDLLALSRSCKRFQRIVFDRTLWTKVDLRNVLLSDAQLKEYVKFFLPVTTFVATKGPWKDVHDPLDDVALLGNLREQPTITVDLVESIAKAAPNLTTLIFENHILGDVELTWCKFPPKLEKLSLRTCHHIHVNRSKSYFFGINDSLHGLKSLDLSNSLWFESHSLMALSKCRGLQELRLADCQLSDLVPYVSLSTRFGFKALTVVDLRRTWVSDREICCLNKTVTLQELYLEAPGEVEGSTMVSDMAVTAFGASLDHWHGLGFQVIVMDYLEPSPQPSPLKVIQVSNYRTVTDISLQHCGDCLRGLTRLDVRGTACTRERVMQFQAARPDVTILSDFLLAEPSNDT